MKLSSLRGSSSTRTGVSRLRRWAVLVCALACIPIVAATASPANASGTAKAAGWYGSQPITLDLCSSQYVLAHGSDGQPMYGQICITKTGTNAGQGTVIFDNWSRSTATAVAKLRVRAVTSSDKVLDGSYYTCAGKTLPAYGYLFCESYNTSWSGYGNLNGLADGTFTVNTYGTTASTGTISIA